MLDCESKTDFTYVWYRDLHRGFIMVDRNFKQQLRGYGLTTAQILYRRPDHPWLLQIYIWQEYDIFPEFPDLKRFLSFWRTKLDGPLHSVAVTHTKLIKPAELKIVGAEFRLH